MNDDSLDKLIGSIYMHEYSSKSIYLEFTSLVIVFSSTYYVISAATTPFFTVVVARIGIVVRFHHTLHTTKAYTVAPAIIYAIFVYLYLLAQQIKWYDSSQTCLQICISFVFSFWLEQVQEQVALCVLASIVI